MARAISKSVFVGIRGSVFAFGRATGTQLWRTALKGGDFVNIVLDESDLFATTKGEVFCLDAASGQIRWNNPMKAMGLGLATIASADASSLTPMAEYKRRQEAADAAAP